MAKLRLKKGDTVRVMSGKHRGAEGEVLQVNHESLRVLVKNVNVIKKAQKPTQENPRGGFKEQEAPIHVSNVRLLDPTTGGPTRIGITTNEEGRKVRVARASGTVLDE
ncbi:MAG: 50S ribosomal protein L24 [Trueperaceae bacterium]|nr:MAG: 50S ribosomal protein L24 [Trueperaceae bacterium]